jgi:polyisoprenoid-binding protein YceI
MMIRSIAFVAAALGLGFAGGPAWAQGSPDPHAVSAGDYKVEPAHTQVTFSVKHLGFTYFTGMFSGASGELKLDPGHPAESTLAVSVPVASVLTTVAPLDAELKGADWFDAAKFPAATFRSTKVTSTGPDSATIDGELTLHGVTRPIALEARFIGAGTNPLDHHLTAGFSASGVIKRSDFGVSKYVPLVGDEVRLTIAGAFEKP